MRENLKGILWPSLGYPEIIYCDAEELNLLIVYVSLPNPPDFISNDDIHGELIPVHKEHYPHKIMLNFVESQISDLNNDLSLGRWSSWIIENTYHPLRLVFTLAETIKIKKIKNVLFNLEIKYRNKVYKKDHCAFLTTKKHTHSKILVASDIHLASRWDVIEKNVKTHFPKRVNNFFQSLNDLFLFDPKDLLTQESILHSFVNPNCNFIEFIKKANRMMDDGEINFIVLIGDLVDYKYKETRSKSGTAFNDTEWSILEDMILGTHPKSEGLRVPVFMTTGNHDYRLYPYKLQIYGLKHCGISDEVTKEYLKRTKEYLKFKYRLEDFDALKINIGKNHSLNYYYRNFNPFDDYGFDFDGIRLVFMDTGSDFFCHPSELLTSKMLYFLRRIFNGLISIGFSWKQIQLFRRHIEAILTDKPIILFCHAPLLNTNKDTDKYLVKEYSLPLKVKSKNVNEALGKKNSLKFASEIIKSGLGYSTIYKNHLPVLSALCEHNGPSVIMSGHIHRHIEFGIAKNTGEVFKFNYSGSNELKEHLLSRLLIQQGNPLGQIEREGRGLGPSYRIVDITNGTIENIKNVPIPIAPFSNLYPQIYVSQKKQNADIVFFFNKESEFNSDEDPVLYRIILQFLTNRRKIPKLDLNKLELKIMTNFRSDQNSLFKKYIDNNLIIFLIENTTKINISIRNRPKKIKIVIVTECFAKKPTGYNSLGLKRHYQEIK